ncbi:MAG: glycoside hydrolase family 78 protein [Propionibacteriaceae bacterium]|jgi:alpha-L-rhamnosidase|nr:glycoside hydrolase family 78 protein [Propionibacteriaceae bacterium]
MRVVELRVEYGAVQLGLGQARPRLSWVADGRPGEAQTAYELACRRDGQVVSGGRVEGADSLWLDWPFPPLASRQAVELRLRLWGAGPEPGPWSDWRMIEAGLLEPTDWSVPWVVVDRRQEGQSGPGPAYRARTEFTWSGSGQARLYLTGHGLVEAELNGQPVSDELLAPGWTSYRHRVVYRVLDVTRLIRPGRNAVGVTVADGWYRGKLGFNGGASQATYGSELAFLLQLEAITDDGPQSLIGPEASWRVAPSPVVSAGLYEGEVIEAGLIEPDWSQAGFDDEGWRPAQTVPGDSLPGRPVAATLPPIRVTDALAPVSRRLMPDGRLRLDFGQNLAGRLRATVSAQAASLVSFHHAEAIDAGRLATRPLRRAASVDSLRLAAGQTVEFEPRFTIHGFRYAEVAADWSAVRVERLRAEVMQTDMRRTGWFDCSHALLNRLHENVVWSMRGNFVSLPTDCPQRDERLGWTGDIAAFAPTALFLYDCAGLLVNWLADLAVEQTEQGTVPNFVPWVECGFPKEPTAAWGDAAVIVPWALYQRTGDRGVLERQWPSMTAWVDQVADLVGEAGLWQDGFQLGDWLDPEAPPEAPDRARTDRYLVATAYHAHSARRLSQIARLLGRADAAAHYDLTADRARAAFRSEWVSPAGRVVSDAPTALALAIVFQLLDGPHQYRVAGRRLVELVREGDYRIRTGFVGTPLICDALVASGAPDDAYHLLLQQECPSWLYPITMGATTVWERWDSILPDGSINPGEMTSFNHYALGAVADFMQRRIGGLAPLEPAYRAVEVAPLLGGGLTAGRASHQTPYGLCAVSWRRRLDRFSLDLDLPAGVRAEVHLPDSEPPRPVAGGGHFHFESSCRPADLDPPPRRPVNLHDPRRHDAATDRVESD